MDGVHTKEKKGMDERDVEDLARFRAALEKLTPGQKREVIQQMLAPPDTP